MARQEGHTTASDLADEHRLTRLAERSVDLYLVAVGEELVEPGTPDDPDVRDGSHGRQATFSPDELDDDPAEEEEEADEDFAPPDGVFSVFSPFSPLDEPEESDDAGEEEDDAGEEPLRLSVR
jgi:hypothetical protein